MTAVVVAITNYYTSMHYRPVQKIARASETGHATNIIAAWLLVSTPPRCGRLHRNRYLAEFSFCRALRNRHAVMAMLSMAGIIISLDSFGPITDNAAASQ